MTRERSPDVVDLRPGRWQDALADVVEVDAVVSDPPYGERTHARQFHGRKEAGHRGSGKWVTTRGLGYAHLTPDDVAEIVEAWAPRCRGWFVVATSHDLCPVWSEALEGAGRYVFAPLPLVIPGMNVRLAGDGPSSWCVWLVVARPRVEPFTRWGTLPGAYVVPPGGGWERAKLIPGAKPLDAMRALVRDYTRPGDLVADPFAGSGTTLLAARLEGRRAVGAEVDPETYAKACARLAAAYTPGLPLFEDTTRARQVDAFAQQGDKR